LNANVFFELGIRVALDRPVALVRDSATPVIPFDNSLVSCHTYDSDIRPWSLQKEIPKLRTWISAAGQQQQNALWRHFGITRRAVESEPDDPVQAKLDYLVAEVGTLKQVQSAESQAFIRREQQTHPRDFPTGPRMGSG